MSALTTIPLVRSLPRTRRDDSTDRHRHCVNDLLEQREDLVGVHPMADLIYESVR